MIRFDDSKCTGCGVCVKACPRGALRMREKKAYCVSYETCMECGACMLNCEFGAVSVTKGTGCLAAIIREDILKTAPRGTGCGCGTPSSSTGGCC
jgi:ferredoxin